MTINGAIEKKSQCTKPIKKRLSATNFTFAKLEEPSLNMRKREKSHIAVAKLIFFTILQCSKKKSNFRGTNIFFVDNSALVM